MARSGSAATRAANPSRRRKKTQDQIGAAQDGEGPQFSFRPVKRWTKKNSQVRKKLEEWYAGECQICGSTFLQRNGSPYFESLYWVSYTTATWIDRVGNVLCLCPQHSAMLQHGPVQTSTDAVETILNLALEGEGASSAPTLPMRVCEDDVSITFVDNHLLDLQEMIRASRATEQSS